MLDYRTATAIADHERLACEADARLTYSEIRVDDAFLPIVKVEDVTALSPDYRRWLGLENASGAVNLIGGGISHLTSFCWAPGDPAGAGGDTIQALVDVAVQDARADGAFACSPLVMTHDLDSFARSDFVACHVPGPSHYVLHGHWDGEQHDFLIGLARDQRKVWRRDDRSFVASEVQWVVQPLREEHCDEIARAVAATSARRGSRDHPLLAAWRLRSMLARAGAHYVLVIQQGTRTLAFVVASAFADVLEMHTYGSFVQDDLGLLAYHAMFSGAVDLAESVGAGEIWFGVEHAWPKRARGCHTDLRTFIRFY